MRKPRAAVIVCVAIFLSVGAVQAGTPLATLNSLQVSAEELSADLAKLPPDARQAAATDPAVIQQAVSNLLIRKAMAVEAEKLGLQNQPEFERQMRLVRERVLSDAWLAKVDADNRLSDAEADRLTDLKYKAEAFSRFKQPGQIKVRHILQPKTPEGRAKAEELLKELKAGADFAELAKQHSTDPGSGSRGGDLGLVGRGRMVPAFDAAAFALEKPGELSDIIETGFGYHIIRLDEKQPDTIAPFSEVREGLKREVIAKARNDARNAAAAAMFQAVQLSEPAIAEFVERAKSATR